MSVGYIWIKATDGLWYKECRIGQPGKWLIDINEFKEDVLFVTAEPRVKGTPKVFAVAKFEPMALIRECKLPITAVENPVNGNKRIGYSSAYYRDFMGCNSSATFQFTWSGKPIPIEYLVNAGKGLDVRPKGAGTYIGITLAELRADT